MPDSIELPDFLAQDVFEFMGTILKEIERASSIGIDEHMFGLSLPAILTDLYKLNCLMPVGPLVAFAVTRGVWLLALKFICAETGKEDILILLIRVIEGNFSTLRAKNLGEQETNYDLYLYISLLSSSIVIKPKHNWKSLSSLYSLILAMSNVISALFCFKGIYDFPRSRPLNEFEDIFVLSFYWITRGTFASSSQCNMLPKNGFVIQNSQNLMNICDKLDSIRERLQRLERQEKQYIDDENFGEAYQIPVRKGWSNYESFMALFGRPLGSEKLKLSISCRKDTAKYFFLKTLTLS